MGLVTFAALVVDVEDPQQDADRWARRLHLRVEPDEQGMVLRGDAPGQTVRLAESPPKKVKNRVHLDLVAHDRRFFEGLPELTRPGQFDWTVLADEQGHEVCVFESPHRREGLKDIVVSSADHTAIGRWWADVFGGTLGSDGEYTWVDDIPGAPVESFDFVAVPEPKTVKNRVHWHVRLSGEATVEDLVSRGATVLASSDEGGDRVVMADPEGNEFCVVRS